MRAVKTWLTLAACCLTAFAARAGDPSQWLIPMSASGNKPAPAVSVRLIAENKALIPQADNRLAVVFDQKPGWHTYWRMPGQAGLPTRFSFKAPGNLTVSDPRFPVPERLLTQDMVSFGYNGQVLFPFTVDVPRRVRIGERVTLHLHADYLACKDMCVPGSADVSLSMRYAVRTSPSEDAALVARANTLVPETAHPKNLRAVVDGQRLRMDLPAGAVKVEKDLTFYPLTPDTVDLSTPPVFERRDDADALYLTLEPDLPAAPATLEGVLVADGGPAAGGWAVETGMPVTAGTVVAPSAEPAPLPTPPAGNKPSLSTYSALLFAFFGGLILNLMPCVFPVLSLKLLQLVEGYRRGERLLPHGIAFTGGVLASMLALSGLLVALRSLGMALGWGFQLQSPWVVGALLILFIAITLNLLGVFEFTAGSRLGGTRLAAKPRQGLVSSFMSGILAVVVASPCTAPFMGAALGYALTCPLIEAAAVFVCLGLGMSLPWMVLCLWPAWTRFLPRPGRWMETFRKVMALPMAGAAVWLGWVLSKQIDLNGMLVMLAASAATAVSLWLLGREQWGCGKNRPLLFVMAAVVVVALGIVGSGLFDRNGSAAGRGHWAPWSDEAVQTALADGHPVFVDFTAAWCITCQANKLAALNTQAVQDAFARGGFVTLVGDWTNHDPKITALLNRFKHSGVPLYLIYRPDGSVEVLPELLTPGVVLEALKAPQSTP